MIYSKKKICCRDYKVLPNDLTASIMIGAGIVVVICCLLNDKSWDMGLMIAGRSNRFAIVGFY